MLLAIALALLLVPAPACTLTVTLTDATGAAVAATVTVRDAAGQTVEPCDAPAGEVVVLVAGQLPDSTPLRLDGPDAAGMRVWLDGAPMTLALRAEPDGTVRPDPLSWASEGGIPATPVPSPLPAPPASAGLAGAAAPTAGAVAVLAGPPLCVLVLALVCGVAGFVFFLRRKP
ncbi:MAG TPA: hypothetical protein VFS21_30035 [Roseiflexaceae bacterium]|nr:hypothetical protein [Roseiflexaceae bacterium]